MNIVATSINLNNCSLHIKQQGAALIVALILLIALSLLAVSSMNTASLDLIMTGNEQYRVRALAAAEAGIAQASKYLNNSGCDMEACQTPEPVTSTTGTGSDTTKYKIELLKDGNPLETGEHPTLYPDPPGCTINACSAIYFRITATGSSERSASAEVIQEMYQNFPSLGEGDGGGNADGWVLNGLGTALN